jgi:hypothetical protein
MILGVCGGIAEYFNLDPTLVRLGWVALSLFSIGFPGLALYSKSLKKAQPCLEKPGTPGFLAFY